MLFSSPLPLLSFKVIKGVEHLTYKEKWRKLESSSTFISSFLSEIKQGSLTHITHNSSVVNSSVVVDV